MYTDTQMNTQNATLAFYIIRRLATHWQKYQLNGIVRSSRSVWQFYWIEKIKKTKSKLNQNKFLKKCRNSHKPLTRSRGDARKTKELSLQKKETYSLLTATVGLKTPIFFLLLVEGHAGLPFQLWQWSQLTTKGHPPRLKTLNFDLLTTGHD